MKFAAPIRILLMFAAMLFSAENATAQTSSLVLDPATPWNIDYADNECRLLRTFGSSDQTITLRLARGGNTGTIDMVIAGIGVPKLPPRLPVQIKFDPQGLTQSSSGCSMAIPSGGGASSDGTTPICLCSIRPGQIRS